MQAKCAAASQPRARPLTTAKPRRIEYLANTFAASIESAQPERDPTIETAGRLAGLLQPAEYKFKFRARNLLKLVAKFGTHLRLI
jgi:hypothetical protein